MKISIITRAEERPWQSIRSVTEGLIRAYRLTEPEFKISEHRVFSGSFGAEVTRAAREIREADPDLIAFLDTWPFYGRLLAELGVLYQDSSPEVRPILRFHAYGDFTQLAFQWLGWAEVLSEFRVEWACGSEPQRKLVSKLVESNPSAFWVCPFPVDIGRFHPVDSNPSPSVKIRDQLGIGRDQTMIVYAGRLSVQKNVLAVVKAFSQLPPPALRKAALVFVGNFDDLPAPFEGASQRPGDFFLRWQNELADLKSSVRDRIHVLPSVSLDRLAQVYRAADLFVSFSLVHDEDYGMAAAEAAAAGLPLVLTEWGGYKGFRLIGLAGKWVRVHLDAGGPAFRLSEASRALEAGMKFSQDEEARLQRASKCTRTLSIGSVSELIRVRTRRSPLLSTEFHGMRNLMARLVENYDPPTKSLKYRNWGKGTVYEKIYRCYI